MHAATSPRPPRPPASTLVLASLVLLALLVSCAHSRRRYSRYAEEPILGSPADVHVAAGHYDGYAVSLDRESPTNVCVRGTGTTHLDLEARLPGLERWQQPLGRWREEVRAALYELRSVAGTDYGVACTEGRGVQVFLTDWREVDAAVRAIGELLRARDLDMEVLITVSGGGVDVRRASLPAEPALASEPVRSPVPS